MKFSKLALYLEKLEKTSSRLSITEILAQLINEVDNKEVDRVVNLLLGQLAPSYKNIVFNIADQMMLGAIARAYDIEVVEVKKLYKQKGDLGLVVAQLNKKTKSNLDVMGVYDRLVKIAQLEGEGSVETKVSEMALLLSELDAKSARFVARIPVGKLRLGFSDKTIIDALSWYLTGDKTHSREIEMVYEVYPDIGQIAQKIKKEGLSKTAKNIQIEFGVPVMPMLASRLKTADEMVAKMGKVAVEPKFDGLRVLIHYRKGEPVRAFTRNLNEISYMFPELQNLDKHINCRSAILDSEAVGLDPETKKMVNFQRTMKRRRKHEVAKTTGNIPISFQIFDCVYKNGKSLMNKTYLERREVLEKMFRPSKVFKVDEKVVTSEPARIREKHAEYLNKGLEGAIIKKASATYVPGRTGYRWVKMKEVEDAKGKLADTVDVLIMGYTRGRGKRAQFGIGQFLAGIVDNGKFKTITKVGTGLSEEQLKFLAKQLGEIKVNEKPKNYEVHKDLEPDFWVAPEVVVELAADELTKSPKHTAGLALRFPRLIKFREDKGPEQVTTLKEIRSLWGMQK